MTDKSASVAGRSGRRLRASLIGLMPQAFWDRLLRLPPVRVVRDLLVGPSDSGHLAEGNVQFESLSFNFIAPYRTWNHANRSGIENRICRLAMLSCRSGSIGIDVGANCGFVSLVMAASVRPEGKVISFEPDKATFAILQQNLRTNQLEGVCSPVRAFVGRVSEGLEHVCLDQTVQDYGLTRVDFLKIDVDGGDFEVLRGAKALLTRWKPVVVVEMHENQQAIYAFLKDEIGYSFLVGMEGETVVPGVWPPNLIASESPVFIPPKGSLKRDH